MKASRFCLWRIVMILNSGNAMYSNLKGMEKKENKKSKKGSTAEASKDVAGLQAVGQNSARNSWITWIVE
jgi:hypothetical protein